MKMTTSVNHRKGSHSGAQGSIPSGSPGAIHSGMGAASEQSRQFASGSAGHPAAIGKSLRQSPYTHTHTHTAISGPAASQLRRHSHSHRPRRPIALLTAFSLLLATSACESYDENPEYWWIGGGVAAAVIVAIVALSGGGDSDSDSDNGNDNGDNGNGNGNGSNSDLPGAPTSLAASANGSSQINLTWQAPADDGGSAITGYQIEYRQGSGAWGDLAADTGDTTTDYDHNGLTAETSYSYRVSAINANGSGPASNEAMAATTSLAADPKPGVPTALTATPSGDGEVTISWTDPTHCGSGNACADTDHQHYLEYRLTGDSDWGRDGDGLVAGSPHATTHTVTGLTNGMSYDFRLAVQLTGEADRGPWAEVSGMAEVDSDGDGIVDSIDDDDDNDGVADSSDAYPLDGCASADSDGDGFPDTVLAPGDSDMDGCESASPLAADAYPLDGCASADSDGDRFPDAVIMPAASDVDACEAASPLAADAFPDDACASVDSDGDGLPNTIIMPGDDDMDACTAASSLAEDSDDDNDGTADTDDVDDDNDGLIEIATRAELDDIRHNLAGSSYDDEDADSGTGDSGATTGAATTEPANCSDVDADGSGDPANDTVLLCGYELTADIDLGGTTSTTGSDITCASNAWIPIGGCGSDGTCGEADSNDDNPFTAILEGNGHTISNLCIEGDGDATDIDVLGLFGHLRGATVRNLAIAEIYIEASFINGTILVAGDENISGALAGYVTGDTVILNVVATDSDADVDLQGATIGNDAQFIGGLVGFQSGGSITASFATGDVDGGVGGAATSVGGLVGAQTVGSITASFATGTADGGSGDADRVGGLVGVQTGGSITASYATGMADGGSGGSDRVGGLVGAQTGGSITASYSFGAVSGEEENGEAGTAWPSGVTEAAHLAGDSGDATTYAGAAWSSDVWDFGTNTQAPALLYVDGYTRGDGPDNMANTDDDTHSYTCTAASFPVALMVSCGSTLLPGPAGSPQDR